MVYTSSNLSRHATDELKDLNELNNLIGKLVIGDMRHIEKDAGSKHRAENLKEKQHLHALRLIWSSSEEMPIFATIESTIFSKLSYF